MPAQQIKLTDHEMQVIERMAQEMGMTVEDAVSLLAKDALARRLKPAFPRLSLVPQRKLA